MNKNPKASLSPGFPERPRPPGGGLGELTDVRQKVLEEMVVLLLTTREDGCLGDSSVRGRVRR